jgi:hypothetical protein
LSAQGRGAGVLRRAAGRFILKANMKALAQTGPARLCAQTKAIARLSSAAIVRENR